MASTKLGIKPDQSLEVKEKRVCKGNRDVRAGFHTSEVKYGAGSLYRPEVKLDLERAWFNTESYAMTDGQPEIIRRAKGFDHYLENETIFVIDDQLLVGSPCDTPSSIGWPHEKYYNLVKRIVNQDAGKSLIEDKNRPKLDEICSRLAGRTMWDREVAARPYWLQKYWKWDGTYYYAQWNEPNMADYEKVFRLGLNGIIKQAEDKMKEIEDTLPADYQEQRAFLEAVIIAMKGTIKWAGRYAKLCRELAEKEKNKVRKKQLEQMAENCDWVPANPPRTFWEALQSWWFVYCIVSIKEEMGGGGNYRFDKIFRPFYEKDKAEGRITYDDALELTAMAWLKVQELGWVVSPLVSGTYAGTGMILTATIGGVDEKGIDITNDLTYIAMDASLKIHGIEPSLCLRVHDRTPRSVILKAIDCIKAGLSYPAFYNDKATIPYLINLGWPAKDAKGYVLGTCVGPLAPGKNHNRGMPGWHSVAKNLWWALHKGINPATGEQHGAVTKDPLEWTCYEDALEAYLEQLRFFVHKHIMLENSQRSLYAKWDPRPFRSAVVDGCIEMGKDCESWEYPYKGVNGIVVVGPINVANSLAAIKKWVFDEKKVTMKELLDALDKNYEGYEELHKLMLSAPKFGNDDDYADMIAVEVHEKTASVMEEFADIYGIPYIANGSNASAIYGASQDCGALPDGKRHGENFCDGTLSPMLNTDTKGPTAVLRSVSKVDVVNTYLHLLNQRFMPSILEGEGKGKFADYIKTWMDTGGNHIQFNCVSSDTLRGAQKNPDQYTDLIVRVAGYSAYFVDLSKGLQDSIIARTEFTTIS